MPPPVILKMMLLLVLHNVRSEPELLATIAERLDWLWFLGFDLDDEVPNHSVLSKEPFTYDAATDGFICPAGERLTRRRFSSQRQQWEYTASKRMWSRCGLQSQCTRSKAGRSLKRHLRQQALDKMLYQAESAQSWRDRKTRQHLMERCFARGTRYGIKQARWRRLWRVEIQEYLTATIQNMVVLVRYLKEPLRAVSEALSPAADGGAAKSLTGGNPGSACNCHAYPAHGGIKMRIVITKIYRPSFRLEIF